ARRPDWQSGLRADAPGSPQSYNCSLLAVLLGAVDALDLFGQFDLAVQILQRLLQLTILDVGVRLLDLRTARVDDLRLPLGLLQVLLLFFLQLHLIALVGTDAPFVLVAPLGAGLVEVLAAGPPERRRRHLQLAAGERQHVLHAALAVGPLAD